MNVSDFCFWKISTQKSYSDLCTHQTWILAPLWSFWLNTLYYLCHMNSCSLPIQFCSSDADARFCNRKLWVYRVYNSKFSKYTFSNFRLNATIAKHPVACTADVWRWNYTSLVKFRCYLQNIYAVYFQKDLKVLCIGNFLHFLKKCMCYHS